MTREEAKELLIHVLMTYEPRDQYGDFDDSEPYEEAITMAIEALKAPTKNTNTPTDTPTDLIWRQDAIDTLNNEYTWHDEDDPNAFERIVRLVPSAGQNCVLCEYYTEIETYDGIKGECTRRTGSDFISRDALSEKLCETTIFIKDGEVFQRMINDAPTIDAVEVVRCKDCKWFNDRITCPLNTIEKTEGRGFCNRGERREDREEYELATEQMEHDAMYEPTYNSEDGSM